MKTNREELLVVAFKLFLTKGYQQTSMVDLAKASGLSKGAFHHYFPRKQDIMGACVAHFFQDYLPEANPQANLSFEAYAHQCGKRYAQALIMLVGHQIPLPAYQAFIWSLIRDDPKRFQFQQSEFLTQIAEIYQGEFEGQASENQATNVAKDLIAAIEGTGAALSLDPELNAREIEPAFKTAIDRVLSRSLVGKP